MWYNRSGLDDFTGLAEFGFLGMTAAQKAAAKATCQAGGGEWLVGQLKCNTLANPLNKAMCDRAKGSWKAGKCTLPTSTPSTGGGGGGNLNPGGGSTQTGGSQTGGSQTGGSQTGGTALPGSKTVVPTPGGGTTPPPAPSVVACKGNRVHNKAGTCVAPKKLPANATCGTGNTWGAGDDTCFDAAGAEIAFLCESGYYLKNKKCAKSPKCTGNKVLNDTLDKCILPSGACQNANQEYVDALGKCVATCKGAKPYRNPTSGVCEKTPSNVTPPLTCPTGQSMTTAGCICADGATPDANGTCPPPVPGTCGTGLTRNANGACVCADGTMPNANGACPPSGCPTGQYRNPNTGVCAVPPPCGSGLTFDVTTWKCGGGATQCTGGMISDGVGGCIAPPNCTSPLIFDQKSGGCITPPVNCDGVGFYINEDGNCVQKPVIKCLVGQVIDPNTGLCIQDPNACAVGFMRDTASGLCVQQPCPSGFVMNASGGCDIQPACGVGFTRDPNSGFCIQDKVVPNCTSGYYLDTISNTCQPLQQQQQILPTTSYGGGGGGGGYAMTPDMSQQATPAQGPAAMSVTAEAPETGKSDWTSIALLGVAIAGLVYFSKKSQKGTTAAKGVK